MTALAHPALPAEVGGYRVVRLLASGSRACTVLVHAADETRVARILSMSCPPALIDAELAAHDAVLQSAAALRDHAVELDDLVTLPDGRLALLLSHLGGPTLDDVLAAHRGRLALGEAVTILAPLVDALTAAHTAGITGIGLRAADIRFSIAGAPVLTRLHDAATGPSLPERFRSRESAYPADVVALDRLCATVASSVVQPDRAALVAALQAPSSGRSRAHALFDLAQPMPVRIFDREAAKNDRRDEVDAVAAAPEDLLPTAPEDLLPTAPLTALTLGMTPERTAMAGSTDEGLPVALRATLDTFRVLGLPLTVVETIEGAVYRVARVSRRLAARASRAHSRATVHRTGIRRRFALAGAAGAAALVAAITLVAAAGDTADAGDAATSSETVTESGTHDEVELSDTVPSDTVPSDTGPSDTVPSAPESAPHPEPEQWQEVVETLVMRWVDCRSARGSPNDVGCEAKVVHAGSAAELLISTDDPRHELLERWSGLNGEAVVVERMGAAVLIDLVTADTTTASLLVVRSEAGWRVRDVIG